MSWSELLEMEALEDTRWQGQSMSSQGSAEVVAEPIFYELDIQKSSPSLWKWRMISLAISVCNRMRLVLGTNKAVDEQTAEKTGAEINLAFAEASQAPLPDPVFVVGTLLPKFNCKCFRTPAGTLRLELESEEAVELAIFHQVANEVSARVNSLTSLSIGPVEEPQDLELQNMFEGAASAQIADLLPFEDTSPCGSFQALLDDLCRWSDGEQVVEPTHSAPMSAFDEPIQSGIFDQFSEQHDVSDSESSLKTMEDDPKWTKLILNVMKEKISEIYDDIFQASDRKKLEHAESETRECSVKLQKEIRQFQEQFSGMFDDLKTNLAKVQNSGPGHLEQQLDRTLHQVNVFNTKDLRRLVHEADGIRRKLVKIFNNLQYRNLSMSIIFQHCASSMTHLVESVLTMTSKFIPVADFNRYVGELRSLPDFRTGVGKVGRS